MAGIITQREEQQSRKIKRRKCSGGEDGPGSFDMTVAEIREEIERKFGWKMSHQRVSQILASAKRKMAEALARAGFAPEDFTDETQENQSLEAAENHPIAGAADSLPGEN